MFVRIDQIDCDRVKGFLLVFSFQIVEESEHELKKSWNLQMSEDSIFKNFKFLDSL